MPCTGYWWVSYLPLLLKQLGPPPVSSLQHHLISPSACYLRFVWQGKKWEQMPNRRECYKGQHKKCKETQKQSRSKGRWREDNRQVWQHQSLAVQVCCALCRMPSLENSSVQSEMFLCNWIQTVTDPTENFSWWFCYSVKYILLDLCWIVQCLCLLPTA